MNVAVPSVSELGASTHRLGSHLFSFAVGATRSGWGLLGIVFLTTSCASEASLPDADSRDGVSAADTDQTEEREGEGGEDDSAEDQADETNSAEPTVPAPGIDVVAYPSGPYGTKQGATVEDLEFFGWRNPVGSSFDLVRGESIRFSDYYNSQGVAGQGAEYILLNVVASWCGVCRSEYTNMAADQVYAKYAPRGLEILGVLYEDNNSDPSRFVDMTNWAQAFSVSFPFVNDPGFKTGRYFDRSATPMNMIIDARTMQIVQVGTGYRPDMFDDIDLLLQERGR